MPTHAGDLVRTGRQLVQCIAYGVFAVVGRDVIRSKFTQLVNALKLDQTTVDARCSQPALAGVTTLRAESDVLLCWLTASSAAWGA